MKLMFKEHSVLQGDVNNFVFTPQTPVAWRPGQYVHYRLPHDHADDRGNERWFTISSAPYEKHIQITTRIDKEHGSSFKKKLLSLVPGEVIEADEPGGKFVIDDLDKDYVLIAGGIGITPFRSILSQLHHDGKQIKAELLYANRDESNIPFKDELEAIRRQHPGFNITYFSGDKKIDESILQEYGKKLENPIYYVSGPEPMVEGLKKMLESIGVDEQHSKFDYFPGYKD